MRVSISDHEFNAPENMTVPQALTIRALHEFDEESTQEPVYLSLARYGSNGDVLAVLSTFGPAPNRVRRFFAGGNSYECENAEDFDHYLRVWNSYGLTKIEAIVREDDACFIVHPGGTFDSYSPATLPYLN
jgi:hypothetical protein